MDKLKMHSPDLSQDNIAKLRELFPGVVTEARDEKTGDLRLAVDFDLLRQELSADVVDGPQERYRLDWPGKREALALANAPVAKTLRPVVEESLDFETTRNLFIEGDNLDALKLLQESYLGKVKLIYIDPPYNTGNDFIYLDDFSSERSVFLQDSGQVDAEENRLTANTESNGRFHSDWLSMMLPRIRLSKNFLSDGGIILISCDDVEVPNVRKFCDEVFGPSSFVAQFVWKARQFTDARAKTNVSTDHEYIVAYAKHENAALRGIERDETKFKNPDNDPRGPWMSRSMLGLATAVQRPNLHYDIVEPRTGRVFPPNPSTGWRYSQEKMAQLIASGCVLFPEKDGGRPREKKFRSDMKSEMISFRSIIDDVFTADGTKDLREIFGIDLFPFPKPVKLIELLIDQVVDEDEDIVLDFFGGSGTTAHAVMALNAADGIRRRCIIVQLPERLEDGSSARRQGFENICDVAKERLRRAGRAILQGRNHPDWNRDVGFRVLKIDSSNMKDVYYRPDEVDQANLLDMVDNVREGRTAEDLLFQVLVDWGVDLSLPIRRETLAGKIVFFVDDNALMACFEQGVSEELVKTLAQYGPLRVVFRDDGFVSDALKINVEQIFRQLSPGTEVRSI